MSKTNTPGLVVLLAKLGPKFLAILSKLGDSLWPLVKSLFGVKSVGLVGSVGLYTYLFTWQMAVALVVFIGIHEYGHLWAMNRCGVRNKGMFFVPGFGAVALAEEQFKSARNEAYIAIMGPVFGLVFFVLPVTLVYWYTKDALWAAIGAIMTFINLINLLPINPLDGGRILKAIAYSKRQAASLGITVVVSVGTAILGVLVGFGLLVYMALLGLWGITEEFGIQERLRSLLGTLVRIALATALAFIVPSFLKEFGDSWVWTGFIGLILIILFGVAARDVNMLTAKNDRSLVSYPLVVLEEAWKGLKQLGALRIQHIQAIDNYNLMNNWGKLWYAFAFLFLIAVHVAAIFALGHVPGAELAHDLLR